MTKKSKNKPAGDDAFSRILDEGTGSKKENKPRKARSGKSKTLLLVLVIVLSLALLALGGMGVAGYIITAADTNFPNVYIDGIDAGSLTKAQTVELLQKQGWDERVDGEREVSITGEVSTSSTAEPTISTSRFIKALPQLSRGTRRIFSSGTPPSSSIWTLEDMYSA